MSTAQVAERLSIATETVRNWIEDGLLDAIRVHHHYRVSRRSVEELIERSRVARPELPDLEALPRRRRPSRGGRVIADAVDD